MQQPGMDMPPAQQPLQGLGKAPCKPFSGLSPPIQHACIQRSGNWLLAKVSRLRSRHFPQRDRFLATSAPSSRLHQAGSMPAAFQHCKSL